MTNEEVPMVEGLGNEVVYIFILLLCIILPIIYLAWKLRNRAFEAVHPTNQQLADDVRHHLAPRRSVSGENSGPTAPPAQFAELNGSPQLRAYNTEDCPICYNTLRFAVQANCGHMFCGECITTYWHYGTWLGAINCPVCRAVITLLLFCFQEADPNEPGRVAVTNEVNSYNRRFSGQPRPLMDYIYDIPVLLPHLTAQFFSMNGLMMMFRLRVVMCFAVAAVYILSPLDILPEAVFGLIGVLDDLFVVFIFAIYMSVAYRRFVGNDEA